MDEALASVNYASVATTFNIEMFEWYRAYLEFAFYSLPIIQIIVAIICWKYRSLGRVFYYLVMYEMILAILIPKIPAVPFSGFY